MCIPSVTQLLKFPDFTDGLDKEVARQVLQSSFVLSFEVRDHFPNNPVLFLHWDNSIFTFRIANSDGSTWKILHVSILHAPPFKKECSGNPEAMQAAKHRSHDIQDALDYPRYALYQQM